MAGCEAVDGLLAPRLKRGRAQFATSASGHVPLDIDVSCLDHSDRKQQSVGRTYAGDDGFAPIALIGAPKEATASRGNCVTARNSRAQESEYARIVPRRITPRWR